MFNFSELIISGLYWLFGGAVSFVFVFLCGLFSGTLIGAAGIGGVVLVPLLVYGAGFSIISV
jgi:uncharacterized membrane protein YfcA